MIYYYTLVLRLSTAYDIGKQIERLGHFPYTWMKHERGMSVYIIPESSIDMFPDGQSISLLDENAVAMLSDLGFNIDQDDFK